MAEGEKRPIGKRVPTDRARGPFRSGSDRDHGRPLATCRFLALETAGGALSGAVNGIDAANRCIAVGAPVPQSSRQQELVCLTAAHETCPRYLRGVPLASAPPASSAPPTRQEMSRPIIGASLVLAAALAASFGFLAVRGGFDLPPNPSSALIAGAGSAPSASLTTRLPTATPAESPVSSELPAPSASPVAISSASPEATPTPAATPTPPPTPRPFSDRYALLTKCTSTPDCWIYVIRAGDNLSSIANWFGVSYDRMIGMNPNLRRPIHAGDPLRMPTPTR